MGIEKKVFNNSLSTYKGKKILITGHTGFKGAWLTFWLHRLGAQIRGYSLMPLGENDLFYLLGIEQRCDSIIGDIRDRNKFEEAILEFKPDFVFHLAAQPLVTHSYLEPIETYETNVIGTANLLGSIHKLQNKCSTIIITTDKVYKNNEGLNPYHENDRLGGYDPYSSSKACCEILVDSFRNSFFNISTISSHKKAIATARAGNVIGGGDWAKDRIIPDIVNGLMSNQNIDIRNPGSIRPWQYILEPLYGYLLLGISLEYNPEEYSEAWNFGPLPDDQTTVEELANELLKIWGNGNYSILNSKQKQPHETGYLSLDISKSMRKLNWTPKYNCKRAIANTVTWYKSFFAGNDPVKLVNKEILAYEQESSTRQKTTNVK